MPPNVEMALKLVLASVLGGFVGWEREVHERPAGLRTHILVCMGSALITLVSVSFGSRTADPGRIAAQIVSGIGFLGAGTILRQGNIVRGLTTAASLWTVAGIGMAVGIGGTFYVVAVFATLIVFFTLTVMSTFESAIGKRRTQDICFEIAARDPSMLASVLEGLTKLGITLQSIRFREATVKERWAVRLSVLIPRGLKAETVANALARQPGLENFEWV